MSAQDFPGSAELTGPGGAGPSAARGTGGPALTVTVHGQPAPQGSKRHVGNGVLVESSKAVRPWREAVKHAALNVIDALPRFTPVLGGPARPGIQHDADWSHGTVEYASGAVVPVAPRRVSTVPLDEPLSVEVTFTVRKPASAPKRRTTWPTRRPDLDKLLRATLDGLSDGGVWVDDARVVELTARKVYPGEGLDALDSPGALIRIWRLS